MKMLTEFSDDELLCNLQNGNVDAFKVIYRRYWGILFKHALKMTKDEDESKDVVQEVFAVFYQKSLEMGLKSSLSGYLYTAVRNKILDSISKEKVKGNYLESLENFQSSGTNQTDHLIREKQLAFAIEKEVAQLPAKMRQVFELSRSEEKTYREIAKELAITDNTVKKQMGNALRILRLKLNTFITTAPLLVALGLY